MKDSWSMKKIVFFIIAFLMIIEFREHPVLKPYTDKIFSLVSTQAKLAAHVSDFPEFVRDLETLSSLISSHEYDYLLNELTNFNKVEFFYNQQCFDIGLSHMTLTSYSIRKTCRIIEEYLPSTD